MLDTLKTEAVRPESVLKEFYNRNGCVRIRPDDPEKGRHGGVELRLVVGDMPELYAVFPFRQFAVGKPNLEWGSGSAQSSNRQGGVRLAAGRYLHGLAGRGRTGPR